MEHSNKTIGLQDLVEGFLFSLQAEGRAPRTHEYYDKLLRHFLYYTKSHGWPDRVDYLDAKRVITLGWFIYALVYMGFALASSPWQIWLLFACYGIYYGIVEGVARAFIADLVPEEKRGTAYGLYHGVVGITLLPASLLAGWLWQAYSPAAPFYLGAALAFLAMLGMMALIRE